MPSNDVLRYASFSELDSDDLGAEVARFAFNHLPTRVGSIAGNDVKNTVLPIL